jgi:hypothetical protein
MPTEHRWASMAFQSAHFNCYQQNREQRRKVAHLELLVQMRLCPTNFIPLNWRLKVLKALGF